MISIIIPYYNHWDLVHARLGELHRYMSKEDIEVILVNDASTETDCVTGVKFWQDASKNMNIFPIRYFLHKENGGFGKSMNDGAKLAKGDLLVFLSNDVRITGNFVKLLLSLDVNDKLIGEQIVDWPGGWNEFDVEGEHVVIPYANGWFLSCTREVWDKIGGFDLGYKKFDCEDLDLSTAALDLGYNLYRLNSKMLHHIGGVTIASVTSDRLSHTKRNREYYISKWGNKLLSIYKGMRKDDTPSISNESNYS